jgi:hypothetical protein
VAEQTTPKRQLAVERLAVERLRNRVLLEITCPDDYAAMLLYEEVTMSAATGELTLVLEVDG